MRRIVRQDFTYILVVLASLNNRAINDDDDDVGGSKHSSNIGKLPPYHTAQPKGQPSS
jgi:hypothetical protein